MRRSKRNQKKREAPSDSDTEEDTSYQHDRERKPISGSDWTRFELEDYSIEIEHQNEEEFFNCRVDETTLPAIPNGVLTRVKASIDDMESYPFLKYLARAMRIVKQEESKVDDFAVEVLNTMGYRQGDHLIHTRQDIRLTICKKVKHAKTDVCVVDDNDILLLIQEDKSHISPKDPEPQLIAEAIAAFQQNNEKRIINILGNPLKSHLFPGITMVGTYPTFYKITVTEELDEAVSHGKAAAHTTKVQRFDPLHNDEDKNEGMKPIESRIRILKCFELFKQFL
jgi:hypothetical protein